MGNERFNKFQGITTEAYERFKKKNKDFIDSYDWGSEDELRSYYLRARMRQQFQNDSTWEGRDLRNMSDDEMAAIWNAQFKPAVEEPAQDSSTEPSVSPTVTEPTNTRRNNRFLNPVSTYEDRPKEEPKQAPQEINVPKVQAGKVTTGESDPEFIGPKRPESMLNESGFFKELRHNGVDPNTINEYEVEDAADKLAERRYQELIDSYKGVFGITKEDLPDKDWFLKQEKSKIAQQLFSTIEERRKGDRFIELKEEIEETLNTMPIPVSRMQFIDVDKPQEAAMGPMIDAVKERARQVSSYYNPRRDEEYFSDEYFDWADATSTYLAAEQKYGTAEADHILSKKLQDHIYNNQGFWDYFKSGLRGAGNSCASGTMTFWGAVPGAIYDEIATKASQYDPVARKILENAGVDLSGDLHDRKEGVSFVEDIIDRIVDNSVTAYSNEVMETGEWKPYKQREVRLGILPHGAQAVKPFLAEQGTASLSDMLFNKATISEVIGQTGFTLASIAEGQALASMNKALFRGLKGASFNRAKATNNFNFAEARRIAGKYSALENGINLWVIPAVTGSAEGLIESFGAKQKALEEAEKVYAQEVDRIVAERMQDYYIDDMVDNEWKQYVENLIKAQEAGDMEYPRNLTREDFENVIKEEIRLNIMDEIQPQLDKIREQMDVAAVRAGVADFMINSAINGVLNQTLQYTLQAKPVKEIMARKKSPKLRVQTYNEKPIVIAKHESPLLATAKNMGGEFIEEWTQDMGADFSSAMAANNIRHFINNTFDPDTNVAVGDWFASDYIAGLSKAWDTANSNEAIRDGIYGALGAGTTINFLNHKKYNPYMSPAKLRKAGKNISTGQAIGMRARGSLEWLFNNTLGNTGAVTAYMEARNKNKEADLLANKVQEWVDNHAETFKDVKGAAAWIRDMEGFSTQGNEFGYRTSQYAKLVNDALMLSHLEGTDLHKSLMNQLNTLANLDEASEEDKATILATLRSTNKEFENTSDEEIVANISKNAKEVLTELDNIKKESDNVDRVIGSLNTRLTDEVRNSLIYGARAYEDFTKRAQQIEETLDYQPEGRITAVSDDIARVIAVYGSLTNAKNANLPNEIAQLRKQIKTLEQDNSIESNHKINVIRTKLESLEDIQKTVEKYFSVEGALDPEVVLTADNIMSLPAYERAAMLNTDARGKFSQEQQRVIEDLITRQTIRNVEFETLIQDAAKNTTSASVIARDYEDIVKDPSSINDYVEYAKAAADNAIIEKYIQEGLTYVDDFKGMMEFLNRVSNAQPKAVNVVMAGIRRDTKGREMIKQIARFNDTKARTVRAFSAISRRMELEDEEWDFISAVLEYASAEHLIDIGSPNAQAQISTLINSESFAEDFTKWLDTYNQTDGTNVQDLGAETALSILDALYKGYNNLMEDRQEANPPVGPVAAPEQTEKDLQKKEQEEAAAETSEEVPIPQLNTVAAQTSQTLKQHLNGIKVSSEEKERVSEILDEVVANMPEDATEEEMLDHILLVANQLETSDNPIGTKTLRNLVAYQKALILKKQLTERAKAKQKEQAEDDNEGVTNDGVIETLDLVSLMHSKKYGNSTIVEYARKHNIVEYVNKNGKTLRNKGRRVFFLKDPALIEEVKNKWISGTSEYADEINMPIVAVVLEKDKEGPIVMGETHYRAQPVGILPASGSPYSEGSSNTLKIRKLAIKQDGYGLIRDGKNLIRSKLYVEPSTKPPVRDKSSNIQGSARNTFLLDAGITTEGKSLAELKEDPKYKEARKTFIERLHKEKSKSKSDKDVSDFRLRQGNTTADTKDSDPKLWTKPIDETYTDDGKSLVTEIKDNDTAFINANSRTRGAAKAIEALFGKLFEESNKLNSKDFLEQVSAAFSKQFQRYINLGKWQSAPNFKVAYEEDKIKLTLNTTGGDVIMDFTPDGLDLNSIVSKPSDNMFATLEVDEATMADILRQVLFDLPIESQEKGRPVRVKWQVDYDNAEAANSTIAPNKEARENLEGVFDDDILVTQEYSFNYQLEGLLITNPFRQGPIQKSHIANEDNAKPAENPVKETPTGTVKDDKGVVGKPKPVTLTDKTKESEEVAKRMLEDSKNATLLSDGSGYSIGGRIYARVTSVIKAAADAAVESFNNTFNIATNIGNTMDMLFRDVFTGTVKESYPNMSEETYKEAIENAKSLRRRLEIEGWHFVQGEVSANGFIEVNTEDGPKRLPVAGTLDLLAYDNNGNWRIFDMKTYRTEGIFDNSTIEEARPEAMKKYQKQLSLYAKFLRDTYGINISGLTIIPIKVSYDKPSKTNSYSSNADDVGLQLNGQPYKGLIPSIPYYEDLVDMEELTSIDFDYNKLTEEEKAIIDNRVVSEEPVEITSVPEVKNPKTTVIEGSEITEEEETPESKPAGKPARQAPKVGIMTYEELMTELEDNIAGQMALTQGVKKQNGKGNDFYPGVETEEDWNQLPPEAQEEIAHCLLGR